MSLSENVNVFFSKQTPLSLESHSGLVCCILFSPSIWHFHKSIISTAYIHTYVFSQIHIIIFNKHSLFIHFDSTSYTHVTSNVNHYTISERKFHLKHDVEKLQYYHMCFTILQLDLWIIFHLHSKNIFYSSSFSKMSSKPFSLASETRR